MKGMGTTIIQYVPVVMYLTWTIKHTLRTSGSSMKQR